jgi:hypothetical protein
LQEIYGEFADISASMRSPRINEEWIHDLRPDAPARTRALEDLRVYLRQALPGAIKCFGATPEHLLVDIVQGALIRALEHRRERRCCWRQAA